MSTDAVWEAVDGERRALADLVEALPDSAWDAPSLCDAWRVREVVAHLTLAHTGPGRAAVEAVRGRDRQLTKPAGSLGRLEWLSEWLAAWQGRHPPRIERALANVHKIGFAGLAARGGQDGLVAGQFVVGYLGGEGQV